MAKKTYLSTQSLRGSRPRKDNNTSALDGRPSGSGSTSLSVGGGIIITPEVKSSLPVLRLSELDNFGKSAEDIAQAAIRTGGAMAIVVSDDDKALVVGVLHQFSDTMRHVLTQSLVTHILPPTGDVTTLDYLSAHDHNRVLTLERSIGWKQGISLLDCWGARVNVRSEEEARNWLSSELSITHAYRFEPHGYQYIPGLWTPWRCIEKEKEKHMQSIMSRLSAVEHLHLLAT